MGRIGRYLGCMARLRKLWGGKCQGRGCNGRKRLQFAHRPGMPTPVLRTSRGRGRADRYHDIKRHPECYILLCYLCHLRLDQGDRSVLPDEAAA